MTAEQKAWIDRSSYETLLRHWRYAVAGDAMFIGDTGTYYQRVMLEKKRILSGENQVAISKRIDG